ncbi:Potassium voltage-gated channel sub H member 5 [Phytophthora pseudosyringae]|uniref:Potassium voltage-gated channel sub H member 5 n=1 Tax=Phytophthora pseudosyringae TaxID=221518 RepID=A0A8T1WMP2_9STRA|nr:Potassium voltage-gated channel sub H member 5 [Phytophthora pseudosyringae]
MRRGSFTGTIPVSNHVPPRVGSVGRLSSTSSIVNTRASAGRTSQQEGKAVPPLRKQRSALATQPGPPGPRLRLLIWFSQFYLNHKRPLGFILAPPLLDPRSNEKLAWDALVMVVVLYSAVIVPVQMGFPEIQLGVTARAIAISSDVLFFLDVVHNFFVGYYADDDENMVRDRRLIAKRYVASWFLPDVLAFLPLDYFLTTTAEIGSAYQGSVSSSNAQVLSLRLARLVRLLRITKLTRLIKLRHFAAKVEDAFDLDAVLARLTRLIGQVLLVTHIFSCFWHLIGFTTEDEGITWMIEAGVRDRSVSERYVYSFYWVVATVCGVGYGDIHATNKAERLFAMGVSVVGASGYGLIIGSLTKILENWHRETTSRARKLSMIQAFVRKKRLPRLLKVRLMRYFRHYIAKTSAFDERELLCEFSLSLRGEILHETYRNTFFRIPAFKRLSTQFVLDMAMFIKPLIVVKGDVLAREGCVGTEMFILNTGLVEVRRTSLENTDWVVVLEVLTARGVFGEASLLQYAPHANSYTAKATSDLFTLPKEDFDRLIEEFPDAERALFDYHQERSAMYDLVFEQTLARYRVYIASQNSDPVSGLAGLENMYPTLTVLLDGALKSYRSLPLPVLQALDLQLSMGVSVFNSSTEKVNMIWLLSQDSKSNDDAKSSHATSVWQHMKWQILTPINPFHWSKLAWDVFNSTLLVYCAIAVPYEAAFFGEDGETLSAGMDILVEIAFIIDIVVNLRTAVVVDLPGEGHTAVLERRTKWRVYLRGWFWLDFLSALPIPVIVAVSDESIRTVGGSGSWALTLVRLLKLARVVKFIHTLQREESSTALGATISSHHTVARVVRLVFRVSFIAHVLACGYFMVARISRSADGGAGVRSYFSPEQNSKGEMYVYFLYWATTTMTTVGYGDTPPHTVAEVAYVSCGVLVGASTFTYVVGTLSSVVEELNEASDTSRTRMDHLKAYLRERKISQPLAERLRRYYEYYLLQGDDEHEETILAALSDELRSQLVLHLNRDVVSKISFFATQDDACVSYLMGILDPEFCTPGEYVFKEGQVGRHMYFLVKGAAEVVFKAGTSEDQVVATLLEGSYFGEIAMLTRSKRAASIRAKTYMSLFVLSLHGLDRMSLHYPEMAHNIIQEFRNKITHIKQTSVKQLGSLVQEDIKQARERSGLLAASPLGGPGELNDGGSGADSELRDTLGEFESILSRMVGIYGGGDRGKRKALACVMQYLHKYEFSIDDFLLAAEELNYGSVQPAATKITGYSTSTSAVLNSLQIRMRRRSSFS